jgi:hypothetical protein
MELMTERAQWWFDPNNEHQGSIGIQDAIRAIPSYRRGLVEVTINETIDAIPTRTTNQAKNYKRHL